MFDFSTFPTLTTPRLHLRALTEADAPALVSLYSAPEVMRFLTEPVIKTAEDAEGLISWFSQNYDEHESVQWAFTLKDTGEFIGTGGTYAWDREDRHVDIGYHVIPSQWSQGYATEAANAIIVWCFDALNVHRIQADCTEANIGSARVLLKCGFQLEGTQRESVWEHGRFVNIQQYSLLKNEYYQI